MKRFIAALLLCGISCPMLPAGSAGQAETRMVTFNFDRVDVRHVAEFVSDISGREIVVSTRAAGTRLTAANQEPVTVSELLDVFKASLDANGLAMTEESGVLKIDLK